MLAGYLTWNDYRGPRAPTQIRIEHHKTGEMVLHPLEGTTADGGTLFYEEAEAVLAKVPRLRIIMRDRPAPIGPGNWDNMSMARLVRALCERLGLPETSPSTLAAMAA
ncbi:MULTISPECIES: hypothetical protein [unclassified Bradyrhizobium]|uniref:hypothetical protein n=1 Tax=unclassified Bradyrhizobium TaxID=2631580 RepID=UPI0028E6C42F|nr:MULTISPECIES: hypothetical protein [unclassified Bradyrhizobium]